MLAVVSPAKSLDFDTPLAPVQQAAGETEPRLLDDTAVLADIMRQKSYLDLMEMMKISENLAQLNVERFQQFTLPMPKDSTKPAVLAFTGDVYQGLDANSMSQAQLAQAQKQLRILSGFYGLLRPLDRMMAYRLEMGKKVATEKGDTLYAYWQEKVTAMLNDDIAQAGASALVNLASNEYFKVINKRQLSVPVIETVFQDEKNGNMKVISFYAKKARGLMARYIIDNQVQDVEQLKEFALEGYQFDAEASTNKKLVFKRTELAREQLAG
ncbi:peroxide stress protein YaaA [Salinibius halmophilus]|uniref:peroxide stress protein YaaA n=1 Tax=Salinibius halmophilus TaxID=1853216 RepID=UPI000E66698C|nr:peroxide stress protein YaaA [Salinibius halmophilus]